MNEEENKITNNDITKNELEGNNTANNTNNSKANILCVISMVLAILALILIKLPLNASIIVYKLCTSIRNIVLIISFTIMVYVRVKYPQNVFGIVLMALYIAGAILCIMAIIFIIVACGTCMDGIDSLHNCPG